MHSTHLEHTNFSECNFLHHLVFFSFQKLFDGYKLTGFLWLACIEDRMFTCTYMWVYKHSNCDRNAVSDVYYV